MASWGNTSWGNTASNVDTTWGGWTSQGNTTGTMTSNWYRRLTGPTYRVDQATLILVQNRTHKPEKFANIGGVQFKRTTRIGKRHYYQALA